jgi:hypothetical protein
MECEGGRQGDGDLHSEREKERDAEGERERGREGERETMHQQCVGSIHSSLLPARVHTLQGG